MFGPPVGLLGQRIRFVQAQQFGSDAVDNPLRRPHGYPSLTATLRRERAAPGDGVGSDEVAVARPPDEPPPPPPPTEEELELEREMEYFVEPEEGVLPRGVEPAE